MENEIFEQKYMAVMQQYDNLETTIKELTELKDKARAELQEAMEKYNVRTIDNEFMKITLVSPSVSTTIDTTTLRATKPELYDLLVKRFTKRIERKASLRVKIK